jgi:RHS repeat-associated protein
VTSAVQLFTYNLQGRMSAVINDGYTNGTLSSRERTSYQYNSGSYRVHLLTETGTTLSANAASETWTLKSETSFLADSHNHTGYTQTIRETKVENGHTLITDYTFGNDEILQRVHGTKADGTSIDETLVFGHDGHGSVRYLSDLVGMINQVASYAAYGAVIAVHNALAQLVGTSESSFKSTLGYSGEAWDTNVQQQYLRARFYNPDTGRFDRSDDFSGNKQDPQSLHKYAYVHGDPISMVDPTGHFGLLNVLSAMKTGLIVTGVSAGAVAALYGATGRSPVKGAYVGGMGGLGWSIAQDKWAAIASGLMSGMIAYLIGYVDDDRGEDEKPIDLYDETLQAISEGIFDAGYDQWASSFRIFKNFGTHRNDAGSHDGMVSGAPFAGAFVPILIMSKAILGKAVDKGQFTPLDRVEAMKTFLNVAIAVATNDNLLGLKFKLPKSLSERMAKITHGFVLPGVSGSTSAAAYAEAKEKLVTKAAEHFDSVIFEPLAKFMQSVFSAALQETAESDTQDYFNKVVFPKV